MPTARDTDALLLDYLYDELSESETAAFEKRLDESAQLRSELSSLKRTRELFRGLPEEDPPSSLSAILLHEAAKRSPNKKIVTAVGTDERPSLWERLFGWFPLIMQHPAATAVAALVLVGGVAGALYLRGVDTALPEHESAADHTAAGQGEARVTTAPPEATVTAQPAMPSATDESKADNADDLGNAEEEAAGFGDSIAEDTGAGPRGGGANANADPNQPVREAKLADESQLSFDGTRDNAADLEPGAYRMQLEKDGYDDADGEVVVDGKDRRPKNKPAPPARGRSAKPEPDSFANAVSGADPLVADPAGDEQGGEDRAARELRADEAERARHETSKKQAEKSERFAQPPPPSADTPPATMPPAGTQTLGGGGGSTARQSIVGTTDATEPPSKGDYKSHRAYQQELDKWSASQQGRLNRALDEDKCRSAAQIANDILDRNPEYYFRKVESSKRIQKCSGFIAQERSKRQKARDAKRRSKAPKQKAPAPDAEMDAPAAADF